MEWAIDEGPTPAPAWLGDRPSHPVVRALNSITEGSAGWDPVIAEYSAQAPDWLNWTLSVPHYFTALARGLQLVDIAEDAIAVELCSGSSPVPREVLPVTRRLLIDGSLRMLELVSESCPRACSMMDALPLKDGCAQVVVVLNGTLQLAECVRVLARGGSIIAAWTFGEHTPMYVSWIELLSTMPAGWGATLGRGKWGEFGVIRESRPDARDLSWGVCA